MFLQASGCSTGPAHPECASLKSIKTPGMLGSGSCRREGATLGELGVVEHTSSVLLKWKTDKRQSWLCPQTAEIKKKKLQKAIRDQKPPQECSLSSLPSSPQKNFRETLPFVFTSEPFPATLTILGRRKGCPSASGWVSKKNQTGLRAMGPLSGDSHR